jgi:hypothetical protein
LADTVKSVSTFFLYSFCSRVPFPPIILNVIYQWFRSLVYLIRPHFICDATWHNQLFFA